MSMLSATTSSRVTVNLPVTSDNSEESFFGAGGLSVITGITVPSVSLYRRSHDEPLDFQSNVAPCSTREGNDISRSLQTTSEARTLLQLRLYF